MAFWGGGTASSGAKDKVGVRLAVASYSCCHGNRGNAIAGGVLLAIVNAGSE